MNVFVSETCFRQVFGSAKGSSTQRQDDFNRLVARLQAAQTRDDLQVKGLGTKKYRSINHDVYGVDLNNGLTAERVIFYFLDPNNAEEAACFDRYRQPGQAETVLLAYCSEHDAQHRSAQLVASAHARGDVPQVVQALPDTSELAELERIERLEVPWRTYAPGDLERYGSPRTPVLTADKFRIVNDFLSRERPLLVTGAAGSGKTELGLRILADYTRSREQGSIRALYLTFSQRLLSEVETRCPDDVRPSCDFLTFETLLRTLSNDPAMRFAGPHSFNRFAAALRSRSGMGGTDRHRMLRLLDERGGGCVYAEVYGVIGGSMGAAWDRLDPAALAPAPAHAPVSQKAPDVPAPLISEEAYLALPEERCGLTDDRDRRAAYAVAEAYQRWNDTAGYAAHNAVALELAARVDLPRYDLVIADEVQDLTEVQIELLHRLVGGLLFMTGDANQVLAPTAFEARRLLRMDRRLAITRLQGNFRNPEVICDLANAVGELRASSRRLNARRGIEDAPEQSFNRSVGRALWWIGDDEEALVRMADEGANVALVTDAATARRLGEGSSSVFTVEQIKGMEFENVILYNVLAGSEERFDALYAEGPKDASLHRVLNKLYVGVTRSCGSLLVAEPRSTETLRRLVRADRDFERVASLDDVNFDLDVTARGYLSVGRTLKEQGAWSAARANLERALSIRPDAPGGLTAREREDAERLLRACAIYAANRPDNTPEDRLVGLLEEAGLYEEALPHARAALDVRREALLTLAADRRLDGARYNAAARVAAFEAQLARTGLDLPDLFGVSTAYDELLVWYLSERCDDLELFALETASRVETLTASLRRTVAAMSHPVERTL